MIFYKPIGKERNGKIKKDITKVFFNIVRQEFLE